MPVRPSLCCALGALAALSATALVAGTTLGDRRVVADNQMCYSAGVSGTAFSPVNTPRECVTTSLAVICTAPSGGLSPTIEARAEACVPV